MAKTTKRVHGPALLTNATAVKYTVPAGTIATRLRVHVQNPSGSAVTFFLSIGADAAGTRLYDAYSIPAAGAGVVGSVVDFYLDHALVAAEVIEAHAGTTNILTLTISVDELTLG